MVQFSAFAYGLFIKKKKTIFSFKKNLIYLVPVWLYPVWRVNLPTTCFQFILPHVASCMDANGTEGACACNRGRLPWNFFQNSKNKWNSDQISVESAESIQFTWFFLMKNRLLRNSLQNLIGFGRFWSNSVNSIRNRPILRVEP